MNRKIIQFQIGDGQLYTPITGSSQYINPDIKNDNYLVYKNGTGYLFEGLQFSKIYTGGLSLSGTSTFNTGEQYTIILY